MPRGKKKAVDFVDTTARPEAPAKVTLGGDMGAGGTAQKVAYAIACLNNAATFLVSKSLYESPLDSMDPTDAKPVAVTERKKMAVKAVQRAVEICNRVLVELDAKETDETPSW